MIKPVEGSRYQYHGGRLVNKLLMSKIQLLRDKEVL